MIALPSISTLEAIAMSEAVAELYHSKVNVLLLEAALEKIILCTSAS
jgi:hypothetical protein